MSLLDEYLELLTDPAHTLVELTFTLVVDLLVLGLLWPLIKRRIWAEHRTIDAEHGVKYHNDPVYAEAVGQLVDLMAYRKSREKDDEPA